jgi:hypothetical protein
VYKGDPLACTPPYLPGVSGVAGGVVYVSTRIEGVFPFPLANVLLMPPPTGRVASGPKMLVHAAPSAPVGRAGETSRVTFGGLDPERGGGVSMVVVMLLRRGGGSNWLTCAGELCARTALRSLTDRIGLVLRTPLVLLMRGTPEADRVGFCPAAVGIAFSSISVVG